MRGLVKELRDQRGLTQAGLANLLGVSEASVNNWERGKNRPAPSVLEKMSGLAADELARRIRTAAASYKWHPRKSAMGNGGPPQGIDAKQWEEIRLLAEARGVEAKDILFRCIRFGINQLRDDGRARKAARKAAVEKRRSKKSA